MSIIKKRFKAQRVLEGAGVPVNRIFGHNETTDFDPFLMLDYFNISDSRNSPGFPWHPHRGIETITYILHGNGKHEDSMGNSGIIGEGELQWMSAGKGIYHQEMLVPNPEGIQGFQFWVNLPAKDKLKKPDYQYIKQGEMKSVFLNGSEVRVISGNFNGVSGPVDKSSLGITMLHVIIEPGNEITLTREEDKQGYLFLFEGKAELNGESIEALSAITLDRGDLRVSAQPENKVQFIYAEGRPIREPIAWYGPVVMNTQDEIRSTFEEIENGTFVPDMNI